MRFLLSRADVRITVDCCSEKLARPQVNSSHANANGQTPLHYAASKDHPEVRRTVDEKYGVRDEKSPGREVEIGCRLSRC